MWAAAPFWVIIQDVAAAPYHGGERIGSHDSPGPDGVRSPGHILRRSPGDDEPIGMGMDHTSPVPDVTGHLLIEVRPGRTCDKCGHADLLVTGVDVLLQCPEIGQLVPIRRHRGEGIFMGPFDGVDERLTVTPHRHFAVDRIGDEFR